MRVLLSYNWISSIVIAKKSTHSQNIGNHQWQDQKPLVEGNLGEARSNEHAQVEHANCFNIVQDEQENCLNFFRSGLLVFNWKTGKHISKQKYQFGFQLVLLEFWYKKQSLHKNSEYVGNLN